MAIRQKCIKKRASLLNATLHLVNNNGFHDATMSTAHDGTDEGV